MSTPYTLYENALGRIVARGSADSVAAIQAKADNMHGVLIGESGDPTTQIVDLLLLELIDKPAFGATIPATATVNTDVTISGLVTPCRVYVNGTLIAEHETTSDFTLEFDYIGTHVVELVSDAFVYLTQRQEVVVS